MSAEDHYALVKSFDFEGRNVESGTPPGHIDAEILTLVAAKFAESRRANSARPQAFKRSTLLTPEFVLTAVPKGALFWNLPNSRPPDRLGQQLCLSTCP